MHTDTDTDTATPAAGPDVLRHRPRLLGLAYRMLGDLDDAEDVVQDAYLRWHQAARDDVVTPEAWLVTVVTRLAIDRLRRAAKERAAFLLREVFGTDYAEIARILDRRPDAVRQMVHRARTRVQAERPRVPVARDEYERLVDGFLRALESDDAPALLALLAPEVTLTSDSGGLAAAARRTVLGPDRVARFLLGVVRKFGRGFTHRPATLNGAPALLTFHEGTLITAWMLEIADGRVRAVYSMRNPEKLRRATETGIEIR